MPDFRGVSSTSKHVSMRPIRIKPPTRDNKNPPRRMLKKAVQQGHSERSKIVLPSSLVYFILGMARMSPPLHASNQSPLLPSSPPSDLLAQGSCRTVLHCAHRTSTASSCAFCEQEGRSGCSLHIFLRPRVARAQGTHRAIPPPAAGFFSILLTIRPHRWPSIRSSSDGHLDSRDTLHIRAQIAQPRGD